MTKLFKIIFFPLYLICVGLIYLYKLTLSKLLGSNCGFTPTCSSYMLESINSFGIIKGIYLGAKRLCKCNINNVGTFDPIPLNLKGDYKWIC